MLAPGLEAGWSLKTFVNINLYYQGILGMPWSSADLAIIFAATNIIASSSALPPPKKNKKEKKKKIPRGGVEEITDL